MEILSVAIQCVIALFITCVIPAFAYFVAELIMYRFDNRRRNA